MSLRYLFGPVNASFAQQNLARQREEATCLTFDHEAGADLLIKPGDTWAQVCSRLPADWRPDFIALYLPYAAIPSCLWSAPVPLVGLALDCHLLWHYYRRRLRCCDLVLADAPSSTRLQREGITQVKVAQLLGFENRFLEDPGLVRDIDVLFVGNLNPAVQGERLPWLQKLARLSERWRVRIRTGVFGDQYHRLLRRARIVFNFDGRRRCSRRVFEAAAAGALLFEEKANPEFPAIFRDRQECVLYDSESLESLLSHYLEHESQRREIADRAQQMVAGFSFEDLWDRTVDAIQQEWDRLLEASAERSLPVETEDLLTRSWQAQSAPPRSDPNLARDLEKALRHHPHSAALSNALGLAVSRTAGDAGLAEAAALVAANYFRQAVTSQPSHIVAGLNLAESLATAGKKSEAITQARAALGMLERLDDLDPSCLDAGYFRPGFGPFRVEWERTAWANAGRRGAEAKAKRTLLQWQLHSLLAQLTGEVTHHYEALLARPDLSSTWAALGRSLAAAGNHIEAVRYFGRTVSDNPLDREAARLLFQAYGHIEDVDNRRKLARDRQLLSRAAPQVVPAEAWFVEGRPAGNELASLIILCCNQLEYTRQCLESVLKHTRHPYELIIVDNASTDDTPAFLNEFRKRSGPVRVEIIRNETNRGFPAGCNQALVRARGRYLLFLNNDTVVTPGWLAGLIACSLDDWPRVGLVGAVSNYAPDAQGIRCGDGVLANLDEFAFKRQREFKDRRLNVHRLTGFCLLVRREVMDRLGGSLDERYGTGFFDDDDLCVRAREQGYELAIAQEVFVYHFGSRTFKGLNLDTFAALRKNFELFKAKWGEDYSAGYRLPQHSVNAPPTEPAEQVNFEIVDSLAPSTLDSPADAQPLQLEPRPSTIMDPATIERAVAEIAASSIKVTLCMIVKNEEVRLPDCLRSVAHLFGQIVIVDTGSTDRTKEVASAFPVEIYESPWANSFAQARNECLRHAKGKWIVWLDADDRLDQENQARLEHVLKNLGDEIDAYAMKVRSVMDKDNRLHRLLDQVRMFPNHPLNRWHYRAHEQILPAVRRRGGDVRWTEVIVDHVGYQDPDVRLHKLERNLALLRLDAEDMPDDAFNLFNLGWTLLDLSQTDEARQCLQRSLELSDRDSSIVRKLYHLLALVHNHAGQRELALETCRKGLHIFPDDAELLVEAAVNLRGAGDFGGAEEFLLRLLESKPCPYFGSVEVGLRGYRGRQLLAEIYREQARNSEAEIQWRAAVAEAPQFVPAWRGLASLYLAQSRWQDVDWAVQSLAASDPEAFVDAAMFQARAQLARLDHPAAKATLENALLRAPETLSLLALLSQVLLQEGQDWLGAERVLRKVLDIAPNHAEARHNLEVLLKQHGGTKISAVAAV